jgi:hypothetical protein
MKTILQTQTENTVQPTLIQQKLTLIERLPTSPQMHGFFCRYLLQQNTLWVNPAQALHQLEELMQWNAGQKV